MTIRLQLLGGLRAYDASHELDWLQGQRLRAALLVYLAIERSAPRSTLTALFWPESDEEAARHALRQSLYRLRGDLGADWLEARTQDLRITERVETDVGAFEAAIARGDPAAAVRLYGGHFLEGTHLLDLKPWENWVDARRATLARAFRKACRDWVDGCRAAGDHAGAIEAAQHWVLPDPSDDEAQHKLVEVLAEAGRRTDAIRQYETYARLLGADGLEPLDETKALYGHVVRDAAVGPERAEAGPPVVRDVPRGARRRRTGALAGLTAIALASVGTAAVRMQLRTEPVETFAHRTADQHYMVVPTVDEQGNAGATALEIEATIRQAVAGWDEVDLVDPRSPPEGGRGAAVLRPLASRLGADAYITTVIASQGEGFALTASLVPVSEDRPLRAVTRHFVANETADLKRLATEITDTLILRAHGLPAFDDPPIQTRSLAAYQAYGRGQDAMRVFDLMAADSAFLDAIESDPRLGAALFGLARVRAWREEPSAGWTFLIERALSDHADLPDEVRPAARGLLAMGNSEWSDGCAVFDTVVQLAPGSFSAWYDRSTCLRRDPFVLQDRSSPSGWSFRSSYREGLASLEHALTIDPSGYQLLLDDDLERLQGIMKTTESRLRRGLAPESGGRFFAYVSLAADTVAFTPYPDSLFFAGDPGVYPRTATDAVIRQRRALLDHAVRLSSIFPDQVDPIRIRALARELLGDAAAINDLRQARLLAPAEERPRIAATEALVAIKFALPDDTAAIRRARALADSALSGARYDGNDPSMLAVAAILGRLVEAERVLRSGVSDLTERAPLQPEGTLLLLYSAAGGPRAEIEQLEREVDVAITNGYAAEDREAQRREWIGRAASLVYPDRQSVLVDSVVRYSDYLLEMQAYAIAGDTARVLGILGEVEQTRARVRPADVQFQTILPEAKLLLVVGQQDAARHRLSSALATIRWKPPMALMSGVESLSMLRAILLYAELSVIAGDAAEAKRWLRPVEILWDRADTFLTDTVQRVRLTVR